MPEIAGDAALLVDPFSVDSIKEAMIKIIENTKLKQQLILKGIRHSQMFSWKKTAFGTYSSIQNVKMIYDNYNNLLVFCIFY